MKRIGYILLLMVLSYSCLSRPKNFTYSLSNEDTGLGSLIDINGYYVSQRGCDTAFYSMYMFYANGLFTIATTSRLLPELEDCFKNGGTSKICQYPLWGIYRVEGNLIKTQVIGTEGVGYAIFRDYKILPDKRIVNVSDYVEPQHSNLGYMENYPSFTANTCEEVAKFYKTEVKRDSTECPFLKKSWFSGKQ